MRRRLLFAIFVIELQPYVMAINLGIVNTVSGSINNQAKLRHAGSTDGGETTVGQCSFFQNAKAAQLKSTRSAN